jgi:hypothetical protein
MKFPPHRLLALSLLIGLCISVDAAKPIETKPRPTTKADSQNVAYRRMKMVRVMDREGWGEPVEAFRLLIPSDWKTEGGVRWVSDLGCPPNIIQLQFRATAPDGVSGIEFLPSYTWTFSDDPMMQNILQQQAQNRMGCTVGPVVGPVEFLRQQIIPRMRPGARVLAGEILPAATKTLQAGFATMNQQFAASGLRSMQTGEVGRVRLAYPIGQRDAEEWISASVVANISVGMSTSGALQGNLDATARNYQLTGQDIFVMRAPKGQLDAHASLFSLIFDSVRVNPQYIAAVTQFYTNIGRINAQAAAERSRIWREAQAYIDKTRRETYEYQQQVQNRIHEQFGQMIRGVETYVDPRSHERVELSAGYQNAWSNGKGEYLLSESVNFDPRVVLKEDWTLMKKEHER